MTCSSNFWDALAPHHSALENSYLDLPSLCRIQQEIRPPVLVVGAGQGLIVAALQAQGLQCDGVDLSAEMIRYAQLRRGLALVHAGADDIMGGEAVTGQLLSRGDTRASLVGIFIVAGKEERLPHAESVRSGQSG